MPKNSLTVPPNPSKRQLPKKRLKKSKHSLKKLEHRWKSSNYSKIKLKVFPVEGVDKQTI